MECNKGEADRARDIAVKKFNEKDFIGGKKFALKAQNMYPKLEGLSQLLATLDVYISSEKKINGVTDWYGVLGVDPMADDDTIRKTYRKLALTLHPDKNKSAGADGAFNILSEAWSLLSDTSKKIAYDEKRNFQPFLYHKKVPVPPSDKTESFCTFMKCKNSDVRRAQQYELRKKTKMGNPKPKPTPPTTFWTFCSLCKIHHEYSRVYLNQKLICPNCHEPFCATEVSAPHIIDSSSPTKKRCMDGKSNCSGGRQRNY